MAQANGNPGPGLLAHTIETAFQAAFWRIMLLDTRFALRGVSIYRGGLEIEAEQAMAGERGNRGLRDVAVVQINEAIKHADALKEILSASLDAAPALSGDSIGAAIGKRTGIATESLRKIFSALDNLNMLKTENGVSANGAIDSVVRAFGAEKFPGLDAARAKIAEAVDAFTDDNPVSITLKARRLAYLYERIFIESEIITDARPVYNSDGSAILEFVVGHSLLIAYHQDSGVSGPHVHSRLHLAMDLDDIISLKEACDRAIRKGVTLRNELGNKARVLGDDG